jgi:hypothetical protein
MAATLGKDGGVVIGGSTVTFIDSWTLNLSTKNEEVTAYGDSGPVRVNVFRDWTADISGTLDRSDTMQAALLDQFEDGTLAAVLLNLKTGTSSYWYGSGVLRSASVRSQVASKVSVQFSFDAAGQLNYEDGTP